MSFFTRRRWEFRTYAFGVLILGLSIISVGTFFDMVVDLINFNYKYLVIKICLSIGSIIYIIGVIVWSDYTKKMIERFEKTSLTDSLTGALNRKGIEKIFAKKNRRRQNIFYNFM